MPIYNVEEMASVSPMNREPEVLALMYWHGTLRYLKCFPQ